MKNLFFAFAMLVMSGVLAAPAEAESGKRFSTEELDQILEPVALYPDDLLSDMLIAATYPEDVDAAAELLLSNPAMREDGLESAAADEDWDDSVKTLVAFPSVLTMMGDYADWTQELGEAFLNQPGEVMDSIQQLRQQAYQSAALQSNDWQKVVFSGGAIRIEALDPAREYAAPRDHGSAPRVSAVHPPSHSVAHSADLASATRPPASQRKGVGVHPIRPVAGLPVANAIHPVAWTAH